LLRENEAMTIDDITLKIIWDRLVSVMNEAAETLYRSAFSPLVRESRDGATALLTPEGETLAIAVAALPSFASTQQITLQAVLAKRPLAEWREGDVMISNDPWIGPAQINDCTMLKPIFHRGRLVAFSGSVAHSPDLGGVLRYNGAADVFEEGLQLPMFLLYEAGKANQTLFDIIAANSRVPTEALGDLNAQLASHDVAEKRLMTILEEYELADLEAISTAILTRTEKAMRSAIAAIPDGEYHHSMIADGIYGPLDYDRSKPAPEMHLSATIRVTSDEIEVDLTESHGQVGAAINSTYPFTYAYCAYTLRVMLLGGLPQNGGSVRPIRVTTKPGTVYDAKRPAATMSRAVIGHTVSDLIFVALKDVLPDKVRGNGGSTPTWVLVLVGANPDGASFQRVLPINGGLGGQEGGDGQVLSFPSNTQNQGVETLEAGTPILVETREIIADSGGAGRFRGGNGVRYAVRAVQDTYYSLAISHVAYPPDGVLGGQSGRAGRVHLDGRALAPGSEGMMRAGEVLTLETPGGGGFGDPTGRDPDRLSHDVAEGMVSPEKAQHAYGAA
jgi:N-methylhydantoinase B